MIKITKVIGDTFEAVKDAAKDSVKQLVDTVSPGKLVEQATGIKSGNEMRDYLRSQDPNLSAEDKNHMTLDDEKKLAETRKMLAAVTPAHMRLPHQQQSRPYESLLQEEERKKAMAVEAQKKQQSQIAPTSQKQAPGMLLKRKKKPSGAEFRDSKAGW